MGQTISKNAWPLDKHYAEFNRLHFNNALPKIPVKWTTKIKGLAESHFDRDWKPIKVVVNAVLKKYPATACVTLLHEMAHISLKTGGDTTTDHGEAFQAIMKRLAREDAFWEIW